MTVLKKKLPAHILLALAFSRLFDMFNTRPYLKCFTCEKKVAYLEDICCNDIGSEQKQAGTVVFRVTKLSEREIV